MKHRFLISAAMTLVLTRRSKNRRQPVPRPPRTRHHRPRRGPPSRPKRIASKPQNLVGKPDGRQWTNDHQDMGFDSIEATFEKPVKATEVRVVFSSGQAAVSKVELKGVDGTHATVWSGINEDAPDDRGPRHWFVRKFAATPTPVQGVKVTIANSVDRG